jgi:hypothetical protein
METTSMTKSNIKFLSFASLSVLVALAPVGCGSDDDDNVSGSSGSAGKGTSGSSNPGGENAGGSSSQGGSHSSGGTAGTLSLGGDDSGTNGGSGGEGGAPVATTARLRVVHASPNAPAVDIYVKGAATAAVENLAYGSATDFIEVDAGTIAFDLRATGAKANTAPAFTSPDLDIEGGADYTVIAAGDFAHANDADTGFRLLPLEHDFAAAQTGITLTRVVHAASAWETVDLDVIGSPDVDLPGLDRFASESNFPIPSGATIDVAFQNASGVLSNLVLPKLTAETELFVIATGNPGFPFRAPANGFALLVVDQDGKTSWVKENPWLHLVHASDVGPVDVYETTHADEVLAEDVAADSMVAFQLPASTPGFTLKAVDSAAASGSATGLASGPTSTLTVGEHYLSYISGSTIQVVQEQFDLEQPTKVLLRGVHAAKPASIPAAVDFGPFTATALTSVLIANVAPGEASAEPGVALAPGNLALAAAAHSTVTPLLATASLTAAAAPVAGERDFVLLTGTAATPKLWFVDTSVAGWSIR